MKLTYRSALSVLRFASDIADKLPERADGMFAVIVKALAIADSAEKQWGRKSTTSLLEQYDVKERTSRAFVRLFFDTDLHKAYRITRFGSDPHLEFIEAKAATGERLYFQEHRYGRVEIAAEFFHTPGFDFSAAMDRLWDGYPNGLYVAIESGEFGSREVKFSAAPPSLTALSSRKARERLERHVARHARLVADGEHRCYLALGPPGTGKTSFAVGFARALGGWLLNIDAASLPHVSVAELGFLLDALRPNVLVIDDFDEAPTDGATARLRYLLARIKAAHRDTTLVLTVNNATKLDPALLRSGRIDEVIDFELPDEAERRELARALFQHYGVLAVALERVVGATSGYNHADLSALVERMRRDSVCEVLAATARLRELAEQATKTDAPGAPGEMKVAAPSMNGSPPS